MKEESRRAYAAEHRLTTAKVGNSTHCTLSLLDKG